MATALTFELDRLPVQHRAARRGPSGKRDESSPGAQPAPDEAAAPRTLPHASPDAADPNAVDHELVRRVQDGDRSAFDLLVLKYQHRVAGLVGRYVADPAEREDVTQEAFLRAYRGLDRFRCESAFYTWLYRVAVNTARNHQVSAGRHRASHGARPMEAEELEGAGWLQDIETPENHAAMHQVREAIDQALASMPECLREAITLREMHGLAYEDIAAAMDCPIGTVRSRIARARTVIDEFVRPVLERPVPVGAR